MKAVRKFISHRILLTVSIYFVSNSRPSADSTSKQGHLFFDLFLALGFFAVFCCCCLCSAVCVSSLLISCVSTAEQPLVPAALASLFCTALCAACTSAECGQGSAEN